MIKEAAFAYAGSNVTSPVTEACRSLVEQFSTVGSSSAGPWTSAFSPMSTHQISFIGPLSASNVDRYAQTLIDLFPQIIDSSSEEPRTIKDSISFAIFGSIGEQADTVYLTAFSKLRESLHRRRGSNAQEEFMFDIVVPFIEFYGTRALHDIDANIIDMPRTAKYYFPYLLGHIEHEATRQTRMNLLIQYSRADDEDIRNGAVEALGYLADS